MIKVADEAWIATALLHQEQPARESFTVGEIVDRATAERITEELRPGVFVHAQYHCVANRRPNPGRYRMLYAPASGGRRLFRPVDDYHPHREGSKTVPDSREIPVEYQPLLRWYEDVWCQDVKSAIPVPATEPSSPYRLAKYFRAPFTARALEAYAEAARERDWPIAGKLELYRFAQIATSATHPERDRRQAFESIYQTLRRRWQVFRPANPAECWNADRIFDILSGSCAACGRVSGLTLRNLEGSLAGQGDLLLCLEALRDIKPTSSYPWMAVSKFLHFWNPKLVPIYDGAVIWNEVLNGVFRTDYRNFCKANRMAPGERGGRFNLNYMLLASHLLQSADSQFMSAFTSWFAEQDKDHRERLTVLPELEEYYATAFEFIAIGAARLEA